VNNRKVLIADDHTIFREGLKQLIARTMDLRVADEAENGNEALRKLRQQDFDLVILDISMPDKNGLDVLTEIKRTKPTLPVLILSMYPEELFAVRALKAGAAGYLTKGSSSQEILDALRRVMSGKKYISPALAEVLADGLQTDSDRPLHESLSTREYQVAGMMAAGTKPLQIAEELAMSVKTVGTYRVRIFKKMAMKNNAELVRYFTEQELL
jgi:DNA-binding NarL/FixJ family response regulator